MTWQGQILPVRALGKCGGLDSDILSAMLWAAGSAEKSLVSTRLTALENTVTLYRVLGGG